MSFIGYNRREVRHCVIGGREPFAGWLDGLKDGAARTAIRRRITRAEDGNLGDHRFVGGGDKATQEKDIRKARGLWDAYRGRSR